VMPSFVDSKGNIVILSKEIARGGEGAVFDIHGNIDSVAKIYFKDVSAEKTKKLFLMPGMATKDLLTISSWPTEVLFDRKGGKLKGFIMPRINGREVHDLYSPASRRQLFPDADWRFLIHVARNLAAAVDTIHSHGHVIGDLNQKGILVVKNGLLKLIDCDSFQVRHNETNFLCDVGVRDFTPPELQDKSFQGIVRTRNHDNFGLAVLCFQMLFLGRHPFVGRYHAHSDVPLEKAIKELYFVYGNLASSRKLEPPPHTLPLTAASAQIAMLFENAFSKASTLSNVRPQAIEWVKALDKLISELNVCGQNSLHKYHKSLSKCPWCSLELVGVSFFIASTGPSIDVGIGPFDVNQIWQKILIIPTPGHVEVPTFNFTNKISGKALPSSVTSAKYKTYLLRAVSAVFSVGVLLNLGAFGGFGVFVFIGLCLLIKWALSYKCDDGGESLRRKAVYTETKQRWDSLVGQWNKEATETPFNNLMRILKTRKTEYENLPKAYQEEKRRLEANKEAIQKQHYLEKFFIDKADINGVGPNLKKVLASYGVETANDITKKIQYNVPNFGPKRTSDLLAWRKKIEARFKFDPSKGLDPSDIAALNNKLRIQKKQLEEDFARGVGELQEVRNTTLRKRSELAVFLERAAHDFAQAQADVKMI
jgi:DNA-binding helix-hairpin-helix protein with protein kinase domain